MIVLIILYLVGAILAFGAIQGTHYQIYKRSGYLPTPDLYAITQFLGCACSFLGFFLIWSMISKEGYKLQYRYKSIYRC